MSDDASELYVGVYIGDGELVELENITVVLRIIRYCLLAGFKENNLL